MRTLGYMKVVLLPLMISVTTMDLSIASPTPTVVNPISEESTLFKKENPEEQKEKLPPSPTGSDITEVLKSLNQTLEEMARILSKEKSYPSTQQSEEQIMRRQDNSF